MKMRLMDVLVRAQQMNYMAQKRLPVRLSYAIGRNRDTLMKEHERYDAERVKLCQTFADKDADGNPVIANGNYQLSEEANAELAKALDELRTTTEIEVEVYKYNKPIDALLDELDSNPRYDTLTADDLRILSYIIDE